MTTEELESYLEARSESQNLDFKTDCPWSINTFAKHILAMSNLRDGGIIIIGVEDGTFQRQGVSSMNLSSYKIDEMKDQMTQFADPLVDFIVDFPKDIDNKQYVVIKIFTFKEIPVISRKNSQNAGLDVGMIYYRNSNRRSESARISNSNDMRDLIELATARKMKNLKDLGYTVVSGDKIKLDEELDGL